MKKVTTIEQAWDLPEVESDLFEYEDTIDPVTHHTIRKQIPRKFYPMYVGGDAIVFFRDKDGRLMTVVQTSNGPAKTTFYGGE